MTVLFLDFDGVLNTPKTWGFRTDPRLDAASVQLLNDLCDRCDAQIVVSSTWRALYTLDALREILERSGFAYSERVVDVTPPTSAKHPTRADQIKAWLKFHADVTRWVILDDEREDLDGCWRHLVQVNREHGLRAEDVCAVLKVLERQAA